jgi:hypothetical protein
MGVLLVLQGLQALQLGFELLDNGTDIMVVIVV